MAIQTDFRPQLHGFDFNNFWDTDDAHRNFIRQKLKDAVPIVAEAIATNPGIGAALVGALGAAYGVGEVLLPGIFDSIVLPIIVNQLINTVNDTIDHGLPDNYGLCGGMAFASLDYYYNQWVVPKGIHKDGKFNVPPNNIQNALGLRAYINTRFDDSWDVGGVLKKMLEWYIVLKTIPAIARGGGVEIQNRTKAEWATLVGWLDQGKPRPLGLLFDSWNIFDNHQLVAYGYEGDPSLGSAAIFVYDNNNPNLEVAIQFDFTGSEMNGIIIDVNGNRITTDAYNNSLKGFFCTEYAPATPPVSWGLQQGLTVQPSNCLSSKETFTFSGSGSNSFDFFQSPDNKLSTRLAPVVSDALDMSVIPSGYMGAGGVDAWSTGSLNLAASSSYSYPGTYLVFAKVWMAVRDEAGLVVPDRDGQPLAQIRQLAQISQANQPFAQLTVLARLKIEAVNPSGSTCYQPYVENQSVTLRVGNQPFGAAPVEYGWTVVGASVGSTTQEKLDLYSLPAAGSTVNVTVTVTNTQEGCIASGSLTFTTLTAERAGLMVALCKLLSEISKMRVVGIINPLGPDDPERYAVLEKNIGTISQTAAQITKLSAEIIEANQRGRAL